MVGIVLVSHSRALALAVQELVRSMTGPGLPLAIAAGAGENHAELGTDAVEISEAILSVKSPEGVLVLMDMGSAILSSETALDLLDEPLRANVQFCAAPFVEGAVAAGVTANLGAPMNEVRAEALAALKQKQGALNPVETIPAAKPSQSETKADAAPEKPPWKTIRLTIRNAHGLHARPAAVLIRATRPFHSEITVRNLSNQRGPVSVKSLSSLALLEILQDNEIEVAAMGDDAAVALEKIGQLVKEGLGDTPPPRNGIKASAKMKPAAASRKTATDSIPVSDGIVIGPGVYFAEAQLEIPQNKVEDVTAEIERLQKAVAVAQKNLEIRRDQMSHSVGADHAGIYEAQIQALQDPELVGRAVEIIRVEQANAAFAWDRVNQEVVRRYEALQDTYLRERAADLKDVGRQVLELLAVKKAQNVAPTEPCILIADDLTPFQISALPRKLILGVILLDGGPTAHSSILLKALGIPAVVQARAALAGTDLTRARMMAFDGSTGKIWPDPDAAVLDELKSRLAEERRRADEEREASFLPGATQDGQRVGIFANLGQSAGAETAARSGAEGVGLFRTEFLFLERDSPPTEDDQVKALLAIAGAMKGKPVVVRTLDAGGDKELPYLQMPAESNPFLGVRAIRLCFAHEELFATQLRAILRAGHGNDFRIMFPMIANVTDLKRAREFLEQAHRDLEREKVPHSWPVETGIMVEIPSAALQAEALAEEADFFSIGTNDLTQYTLAADRGNPELASYQDALHPAVLRLIEMVVSGARGRGRLVAVCGEAASDEVAAGIFVGLGVRELSVAGAKIPRVKAALRRWKLGDLEGLARRALGCRTAEEVRALTRAV